MSETIQFFRLLAQQQPDLASLHCHLAQALLDELDHAGAISAAGEAIERDACLVDAWLIRGTAWKMLGEWAQAANDLKQAARLAPGRVGILVDLASCCVELDCLEEAEQWLRCAVWLDASHPEAQANLGSVLVRLERLAEAEAPCRAALALDGEPVSTHQNLSAVLAVSDPAAARYHRDTAYRRKQIFVEPALREGRRILVLAAADAANVPLRHLMPQSCFTLVRWYVEYATPGQADRLPPYDLAFNSIGDADFMPVMPKDVTGFLSGLGARLLNPPDFVAQTARDRLPRLLTGVPDAVVPRTIRCETSGLDRLEALAAAGMTLPVLMRPLGAHGGQGVVKVDKPEGLAAMAGSGCYLTEFVDFRSQDGWCRKYRAIFVDGRPLPYHLAISPHWLVHYWTAGMDGDAARRAEERDFLIDPARAVGERGWAAVGQIGRRLGLDYGGIDFSVLADGRVLVFEANATMLVHPERDPAFAYRKPAVTAIQRAFTRMIDARCSADLFRQCFETSALGQGS